MQYSLRILTWNVQLRSYIMEALDRATFDVEYSAQIQLRANEIGKRILSSPVDYDIVCFNEVFDETAREILISILKSKYPYYIEKADANFAARENSSIAHVYEDNYLNKHNNLSRPEDSGLMLFSRYGFDADQLNLPSEYQLPPVLPAAYFGIYHGGAGNDVLASKGVLGVRIKLANGNRVVVMATHMQADENDDGENKMVREIQVPLFSEMMKALVSNAADPVPDNHDVIILGDFNIQGMSNASDDFQEEWKQHFSRPGGTQEDILWDAWVYEQSPGYTVHNRRLLPELFPTDPGITAESKQTPPYRRYDYCLLKPDGSGRIRKAQHLYIDHQLKRPSREVNYLSDHFPFAADLHLQDSTAMNTMEARAVILAPPAGKDIPLEFETTAYSGEGIIHWLRLDEDGTFDFSLPNRNFRCELFVSDNLSEPIIPYSILPHKGISPGRAGVYTEKYVVPSAPFFIKIAGIERTTEGTYGLYIRKYSGTSPDDAIVLLKDKETSGKHKEGSRTSDGPTVLGDGESTIDSLFYEFKLAEVTSGKRQTAGLVLMPREGSAPLRLILGKLVNGVISVLFNSPFSASSYHHTFQGDPGKYFILIQRKDPLFGKAEFTIQWNSDITTILPILNLPAPDDEENPLAPYGNGFADITCIDDTTGWGADDIAFSLVLDGKTIIPQTFLGGMSDGQTRSVIGWIDKPLTYVETFQLKLTEEDAIDGDDRNSFWIPGKYKLHESQDISFFKDKNSALQVTDLLLFDGGKYKFSCKIV